MTCIDEPLSWLVLERQALGELPAARAAGVVAHLEACAACRACYASIEADRRVLPPLPARAAVKPRWSWQLFAPFAVAAAALVLFLWLRRPDAPAPLARAGLKGGGEIVLSLVRERDGQVTEDPTSFAPGDRFKVVLTCPPEAELTGEVEVVQAAEVSRPFPPAPIVCGNRVALPGAFRLTGGEAALVCVALSDGARVCLPLAPQ